MYVFVCICVCSAAHNSALSSWFIVRDSNELPFLDAGIQIYWYTRAFIFVQHMQTIVRKQNICHCFKIIYWISILLQSIKRDQENGRERKSYNLARLPQIIRIPQMKKNHPSNILISVPFQMNIYTQNVGNGRYKLTAVSLTSRLISKKCI